MTYNNLTVKELKKICKNRKIKGYSNLNKKPLIELLVNNDKQKICNNLMNEDKISDLKTQKFRSDFLENMLKGHTYEDIMNLENYSHSKKGFIFETICIILIISKSLSYQNYDSLFSGKFQEYNTLKLINNIKELLGDTVFINQGNNPSDLTIGNEKKKIAVSIKFSDNFNNIKSSIDELTRYLKEEDKLCLIVKNKKILLEHKFTSNKTNYKKDIQDINKNNLLFDENDIIEGFKKFQSNFNNISLENFYIFFLSDNLLLILSLKASFSFCLLPSVILITPDLSFNSATW